MGTSVNIHEAKTHFSKLLERVALGEEIIIARAGEPIAKLSPITSRKARTPGGAEGLKVPESFFEALPAEFMRHFEQDK
jgi:prevent-host-death family protein